MSENGDLTQVYHQDYIYIFENNVYQPYVRIQDKAVLVVGGTWFLGLLTQLTWMCPATRSSIFLEQNTLSGEQLEDTLKFTDSIVIYGNKNLDDFALSSLGSDYYYPALDCWTNDYRSPWTRDFFYASSWLNAVSSGPGNPWDFDLGLGMMRTDRKNPQLKFTVDTVKIRTRYGSGISSVITATVWRHLSMVKDMGEINSHSPTSNGFKWQRIGQQDFDKGQHEIVLKTTADGFNAVNAIAVVPKTTLDQHRNELADWTSNSNIRILYSGDSLGPVDFLGSEPTGEVLGYEPFESNEDRSDSAGL